jgi:uncharacterized surface protein with fasciclin (FAS1) repeats
MHVLKRPLALMLVVVVAAMFAVACGDDDATTADNGDTTTEVENDEEMATEEGGQTIVDLAAATDDLSTLVSLVTAADLAETLSGEGPFTVFAPTNAAFEAVPAETLQSLQQEENREQLTGVLTYHVVPGTLRAADLSDGQELTTVNGATLTVTIEGDTVRVGGAAVTTADVEASNGVVHIIDAVLLPPAGNS